MYPVIPLTALTTILGGAATLVWYRKLTPAQKAEADRVAAEFAWDQFGRQLKQLGQAQVRRAVDYARNQFAN